MWESMCVLEGRSESRGLVGSSRVTVWEKATQSVFFQSSLSCGFSVGVRFRVVCRAL